MFLILQENGQREEEKCSNWSKKIMGTHKKDEVLI